MNREDIIRMAREAGATRSGSSSHVVFNDQLERFFQAAYAAGAAAATEEANRRANASWSLMCEKMVAAEREACAKVCESLEDDGGEWDIQQQCANAIRERSANAGDRGQRSDETTLRGQA